MPRSSRSGSETTQIYYKCRYCGLYFRNVEEFKDHKRKQHSEDMKSNKSNRSSLNSPASATLSSPVAGQSPTSPSNSGKTPQSRPRESSGNAEVSTEVEQSPTDKTPEASPSTSPAKKKVKRKQPLRKVKDPKQRRKNMPLPIGKKRRVVGEDGIERDEWFRNPKFKGA